MKSGIKKRIIYLVVAFSILFGTGCSGLFGSRIKLISPSQGDTAVAIVNKDIQSFLDEDYTNETCTKYYAPDVMHYEPEYVTFSWKGEATELILSENKDFSDSISYQVEGNEFKIRGLKANTDYYWKMRNEDTESEVSYFKTEDSVRTIFIEGVTNTRDMGNWPVYDEDGNEIGRMKQGVVFRTAAPERISEDGRAYMRNELKVKTELDLRAATEISGKYFEDINYINISAPQYAENGIFDSRQAETVRDILSVFAEEGNYPIAFHCAVGRDRTGTLAFLLGGLCGMSKDDLCREYDLSFFASTEKVVRFPTTMHKNCFDKLLNRMSSYKDSNKSLSYNIEQYMLDIGLTEETITGIRNNLVESVQFEKK